MSVATAVPPPAAGRVPAAAAVGGVTLALAAVAFVAVFSILAARFGYPDVLDGDAATVLPRLLALGESGRLVWAVYALIPLLLVPAGVGAEAALGGRAPGATRAAAVFAWLAALAMMLGLMRWPSVHWELARAWDGAGPEARAALATVFKGLNVYLGNWLGEFLGELCLNLFFALTAWALTRAGGRVAVLGWVGLAKSAIGFVAMFRNVAPAVAPVSDVENLLLPLWMIVFGVTLARLRAPEARA